MYKYILKRLLMLIPVIICITFIVFSIMSLTPGDPARMILGSNAKAEAIQQLRVEMGLDKSFAEQYVRYIGKAFTGDFGQSYKTKRPVFDEILARFPATLKLATAAVVFAVLISIPAGIISAVKQYTAIDSVTMVFALCGTAIPGFWLGLMLILLFSLKLDWLPSSGISDWTSYILPAISLGACACALYTRMTRSSMLEVIRQDYIRTARAKGVDEKAIIKNHALRNALLPVVTVIGIDFGYLLGGAIIIEAVFAVPGLGRLMVDAIRMKDIPVVMASVIFMAVVFSFVNLAVDVLYAYIDPRIKSQYTK